MSFCVHFFDANDIRWHRRRHSSEVFFLDDVTRACEQIGEIEGVLSEFHNLYSLPGGLLEDEAFDPEL
jgi:hypothetical protein